ncbi:MAG TPA: hypothetical protein VHB77_17015 [Planctomycetaceae bacterium]|nr:hypothetical protein [Planctomycetaceae bacterium]
MQNRQQFARHRWRFLATVLACTTLAVAVSSNGLRAQAPSVDIYHIEEDWQLVVSDPDINENGPQVTCTISPSDMSSAYCAFDLNFHTQPDYLAGGMQLHTWDPLDPIQFANSTHKNLMSISNETVTWTTRMSLYGDNLYFKILNGQSQTWGSFGGTSDNLRLSLPTSLATLNAYSPEVSLENSGVSFASNLVVSQTLMAVRYYDANNNLVLQITTPQVVHPQQ